MVSLHPGLLRLLDELGEGPSWDLRVRLGVAAEVSSTRKLVLVKAEASLRVEASHSADVQPTKTSLEGPELRFKN